MTEPSELTQLRNVVARARELIEEGHHSTSGPCETCKAFIVLINSVPPSVPEPPNDAALSKNEVRDALEDLHERGVWPDWYWEDE